jgi:hypothetical protein
MSAISNASRETFRSLSPLLSDHERYFATITLRVPPENH